MTREQSMAKSAYEKRKWSASDLRQMVEAVLQNRDGTVPTGTCLLCDRLMNEHPPERALVADPTLCPTSDDRHTHGGDE